MRKEKPMMNSQSRSIGTLLSFVLMLICCCLFYYPVFSQKISTSISKDKIVIGEQFFVKIKVENITEGQVQQDLQFPDTINHLEILSDSLDKDDNSTFIHTLTVTSFDSGYWELPSFKILLNDQRVLSTTPLNITVLPVDVSDMQDYHDIKDILEINPENDWWIIFSIIALALIALFAVLWFMSNKKVETDHKPVTATTLEQLYNSFIKKLEELESSDVTSKQAVTDLFAKTSGLSRSFIDKVYQQNTSHLTTGEYMLIHKSKLPNAEAENNYFQFLRLADAVKFAKYIPPAEETRSIFPMLKTLAASVYQQVKPVS